MYCAEYVSDWFMPSSFDLLEQQSVSKVYLNIRFESITFAPDNVAEICILALQEPFQAASLGGWIKADKEFSHMCLVTPPSTRRL